MPANPQSHETPPDSPDYIRAWARDVVANFARSDVVRLVADYRAIAGNKRLAKADREIAAERAKAISDYL